jgi:FkbM family methyltransferase
MLRNDLNDERGEGCVSVPIGRRVLDRWLRKPYYVFRPMQLARRMWRGLGEPPESETIRFPWGPSLVYCPQEDLGHALWTTGVYELAVTEVLWRLADPGETVVDAGANIGYMTSVMASRVGPGGAVYAFEPHPAVYARLVENIERWRDTMGWLHVHASMHALSDRSGRARLYTDAGFETNTGTASLGQRSPDARYRDVALTTLDEAVPGKSISVLKVDVEGHEHNVLSGAVQRIRKRAIRDIVFESWSGTGAVFELLESHRYQIFQIWRGFFKPLLHLDRSSAMPLWEPPTYLATCEVERCLTRLKPMGWRTLARLG